MRRRLDDLIKETIRRLRRNQTECETKLWKLLKNRKVIGKKFLRQHPIIFKYNGKNRFLIADFYCHEARLIIEIDGSIHEKQKEYDETREDVLKSLGLSVIRFTNDLVGKNIEKVLSEIKINI
ncbi:endonuclease domain-containing protein [Candidatus Saganbacteria bacterium]|nr:endonuclease domain-containing protein [Candidatus Saganbacteria bacterium]